MATREQLFEEKLPIFTGEQAETFFRIHGGEVLSVWGRKGTPDYYVVSFATSTEQFGPISLNPVTAAALRKLLDQP
jgi:hypothetical protein